MLGAIIGDVAGSYPEVLEIKHFRKEKTSTSYEQRIKIMDKDVPLFTQDSSCTDDSILTCTIADAVLSGSHDYEKYLREYIFNMRTSESVPQAFYIFLISDSFEDSIRKAISIGGDTDTIAAIDGSLSEAYYGLDQNLVEEVMPYLRDYMYPLIDKFYKKEKGLYLRR